MLGAMGFGLGMALLNPAVQESLGLSDAQVKAVEKLVLEHHSKMADYRAQMTKKHLELRLALQEGNESKAKALSKEIGSLQSKMIQERVNFKLALRKTLGEEKYQKLLTMRRPGRGMMGKCGRHGHGPGGPGGPGPWCPFR